MITVFVFDTKHKVKVTPKVAAKRNKPKASFFLAPNGKVTKRNTVHPVEKNPRVRFFYPSSKDPLNATLRDVRVIGANKDYIVGLEISDKNRFKKFLKFKTTFMSLVEFSPASVS